MKSISVKESLEGITGKMQKLSQKFMKNYYKNLF